MISQIKKNVLPAADSSLTSKRVPSSRAIWLRWEMYLIVLVAAFLRLYQIGYTEFDDDQVAIFRMAHDAVSHGHLVATSNVASIGIFNPPGIIYFLMIPAAFSANPIGGAIAVALLGTAAVFLTYLFMDRYFGRLAAVISSLLFAVASVPVFYSRFMWNQNVLLFFVPLLIFVLFSGAVEKRKGWLVPAILLLGLLVQFHGSGIFLAAPLVVAVALAPKTIRIRDLVAGALSFLFIYSTYIVWLFNTRFNDVSVFLASSKKSVQIDNLAINFYEQMIGPYGPNPMDKSPYGPTSFLMEHLRWFKWVTPLVSFFVIAGVLLAIALVFKSVSVIQEERSEKKRLPSFLRVLVQWWYTISATPLKRGLLILLVWQIVPLLYLTRHSIDLYPHYFIVFMPGPFIFAGIFVSQSLYWLQQRDLWGRIARWALYVLAGLLVCGQLLGGIALLINTTTGHFNVNMNNANYLVTLQQALQRADQLSQEHHYHRVYISVDAARRAAVTYLAEHQMHTPTTVFDSSTCIVLPDPSKGPAVMLTGPYDDYARTLTARFTDVIAREQLHRPGGLPFHLDVVRTLSPSSTVTGTFISALSLTDAARFTFQQDKMIATRWKALSSLPLVTSTSYQYILSATSSIGKGAYSTQACTFTAMQQGDQIVTAFKDQPGQALPLHISAQKAMSMPYTISYNVPGLIPVAFDTYKMVSTPWSTIPVAGGKPFIVIPAS